MFDPTLLIFSGGNGVIDMALLSVIRRGHFREHLSIREIRHSKYAASRFAHEAPPALMNFACDGRKERGDFGEVYYRVRTVGYIALGGLRFAGLGTYVEKQAAACRPFSHSRGLFACCCVSRC